MESKTCTTCLLAKDINNFKVEKRSRYKGEYENTCRDCKNRTNERYRNTYKGYLKGLLKKAKNNAKVRSENRREEAGIFDLTYDVLLEILEIQNGKCYYSNVPMNFTSKSDFQASIERLDTCKGYIKTNVVVCCLEFNDVMQWSKEKIKEMYEILQYPHDCSGTNFALERKKTIRCKRETYDATLFYQCNKCMTIKPLNQFNKNKAVGCKDCVKILDQERMKDPRASLFILLVSAKSNSKNRQKKKTANSRDFTFTLTFDDLVDIYKSQKGLCAYSGLPLSFGNSKETNWRISLERIDVKQGYTRDNVCLICYEFNTGDKRILYNDDSTGSCGWSKEKFQHVLAHIKHMQ